MVKKTKDLSEKIKKLREEVEDLTNKWKRALADYQNLEKRVVEEKRMIAQFANSILINKLLPVLDNLERAQNCLKDKGLEIVINQLVKILQEEGLEEIKVAGEKFNPALMECTETVEGEEDGKVVEVVQKGYLLHKRVLRPAKVKVGKKEKVVSSKEENNKENNKTDKNEQIS